MTSNRFVVLILAGMTLSLACRKGVNDSSSNGGSPDYFPLRVGNTWTYAYRSGGRDKEVTYTIAGAIQADDREYFVFDRWPQLFPAEQGLDDRATVRRTEHGDMVLRLREQDILYYGFSDTTISRRMATGAGMEVITDLESVQDTVATPGGTFHQCYRFWAAVAQIIDSQISVWFAPEVGPVRFRLEGVGMSTDFALKNALVNGKEY